MQKIAKFRDSRVPGYWLVTDFTMNQLEGQLQYLETEIKTISQSMKILKQCKCLKGETANEHNQRSGNQVGDPADYQQRNEPNVQRRL